MLRLKFILLAMVLGSIGFKSFAQDAEWEPQTRLTGYIATEANYFHDLKGYDRNYGVSLSEAGILTTYQPTQNLTIKGVFVYRPNLSVDQMINEANAQWKATDFLNVKIGRFLTPLSPMNTYYYAPVNNCATLPFIISHHEFFPLNMDALSLNGSLGNNIKFEYELFAGGYRNALWLHTGALGIFGNEDEYFGKAQRVDYNLSSIDANSTLSFGGGGHAGLIISDYLTVGINAMKSATETADITFYGVPYSIDIDRFAYGLNIKAKYNTLQLLSEFWESDVVMYNTTANYNDYTSFKSSFIELSNTINKFTPYVRYESHTAAEIEYERYTAGINYKPLFETTFKLEYLFYDHKDADLNGFVASVIYSF